MGLGIILTVLLLSFLFLVSGLIINLIQAVCYVVFRPFSKSIFRRINGEITHILWLQLLFLMEWIAGFQVKLYTDRKTYQLMGKENAIVIPNHISDADTSIVWLLAQRSGCLPSAITVMKKSSKYLPVYGWASWFSECIFLDRNWTKDESILKSRLHELKDFPIPFWLTMFVEGTRLTSDKLLEAQQFAASKGFDIPKNVLVPRTKGFVAAVQNMRSFVPAVYDVTFGVPRSHQLPSTLGFFLGKPSLVYIKRYAIEDIPESRDCIAKWCKDRFVAKDATLEKFFNEGKFEDADECYTGRSVKSLLVVLLGLCVVSVGAWILCQKLKEGFVIVGTMLTTSSLMLWICIHYTKLPLQKSHTLLT